LGDGQSVKFWKDRWADDRVLKEDFPRLFIISQSTDIMVSNLVDWEHSWSGRCNSWNLGWRRSRFEWEKPFKEQLLNLISSVQWKRKDNDRMVWG